MFTDKYDVLVVGGGHAGCEAAAVAANMGCKTMLVTMNLQTLGQMSCNPAMGGIAKGQIVREIDALGGYTGIVSDMSAIQFKMLNKSKGAAMWSPRTQNDRMLFVSEWRKILEHIKNVDFYQDMVKEILIEKESAVGIRTSLGIEIHSKAIILTNGTFLNGLIHIGEKQFSGGRAGESAVYGITEQLVSLGFTSGRMKTGTPPRVDSRSLDYSMMVEQPGDKHPEKFSYSPKTNPLNKQLSCYLSYTSPKVHDLLRSELDKSPMYNGTIKSIGPRYCPSIEDKIHRFSDKDRHQIFVEPEGWNTIETYINGFSSSLPESVQYKALKEVKGFKNVKFLRPGYAIEYDYFPPTQLTNTLETKLIKNLYFAGQINGTTGYEEAAGQGIVAGINAAQKIKNKPPFVLTRNQAYIGVLIDDLITKGTEEPYRMFTSRAEYRMLLRQDNADMRLTKLSYDIGLAREDRLRRMEKKASNYKKIKIFFDKTSVTPQQATPILKKIESAEMKQSIKLIKLFSRPKITIKDISHLPDLEIFISENNISEEELKYAEIQFKYAGYIEKEKRNADKMTKLENIKMPKDFEYNTLKSLSSEAREKLTKIKPSTLSQASRISGVSPSDIGILMVYMNNR